MCVAFRSLTDCAISKFSKFRSNDLIKFQHLRHDDYGDCIKRCYLLFEWIQRIQDQEWSGDGNMFLYLLDQSSNSCRFYSTPCQSQLISSPGTQSVIHNHLHPSASCHIVPYFSHVPLWRKQIKFMQIRFSPLRRIAPSRKWTSTPWPWSWHQIASDASPMTQGNEGEGRARWGGQTDRRRLTKGWYMRVKTPNSLRAKK